MSIDAIVDAALSMAASELTTAPKRAASTKPSSPFLGSSFSSSGNAAS